MSEIAYQEVLQRAQKLTSDEQLRLVEDLAMLVRHRMMPQVRRSILELQGLGKEIWQGVDIEAYIDQERASWNG